jgi:Homeodomain-like domain-containing protein
MIELERRVRLKHYLDEGLSQTAIAGKSGIDRRTIHRWIESGQLERDLSAPPRYGPRPRTSRKIDPYRDYIRERLDAFPKLTAVRLEAASTGPCIEAVALDGSVPSSNVPFMRDDVIRAVPRLEKDEPPAELRRICDGAIVDRRYGEREAAALREHTLRIAL